MKHIRPISVSRAQVFILLAREVREAFNAYVVAKKNLAEPNGQ